VLPADSDDGIELAASRRAGTGVAYRSNARARAVFERYRQRAAAHGWTPTPEHCHLLRHVYVADTNARAREEAEPHLDYFWQKLLSYHRGSMKLLGQTPSARPPVVRSAEEMPLYELDFDLTQKEGLTIVGDPDYVLREIRAQMRELGAGTVMGLFQFGSLPHRLACQNLELFATAVLPQLRRG
jgi:alkanesulfonate monooxygenase SsuD/methylene tetrahydromethanopterin reductase-like flavin-dependent oxidoreductase (luciferase family)